MITKPTHSQMNYKKPSGCTISCMVGLRQAPSSWRASLTAASIHLARNSKPNALLPARQQHSTSHQSESAVSIIKAVFTISHAAPVPHMKQQKLKLRSLNADQATRHAHSWATISISCFKPHLSPSPVSHVAATVAPLLPSRLLRPTTGPAVLLSKS